MVDDSKPSHDATVSGNPKSAWVRPSIGRQPVRGARLPKEEMALSSDSDSTSEGIIDDITAFHTEAWTPRVSPPSAATHLTHKIGVRSHPSSELAGEPTTRIAGRDGSERPLPAVRLGGSTFGKESSPAAARGGHPRRKLKINAKQ